MTKWAKSNECFAKIVEQLPLPKFFFFEHGCIIFPITGAGGGAGA